MLYASAKTRSRVTTPITFSRQNDPGSRARTTFYWENLVLVHFFAFICLNWLYYLYHVMKRFFFIVTLFCLKQSIVFILSFQLLKLKCMQRLYSSFIIFVFICWRVLRSEHVTTIYKHFTKNIIFIYLVTSTECNLSSLNMKGWKVTNIHIYLSPFLFVYTEKLFVAIYYRSVSVPIKTV